MKFKLATAAAAVLMSATASQAADLAKKAPVAVDYVKVCDAYGAGFFYIPGTDTCLKIGGYVRTQVIAGDDSFGADDAAYFGNYSDARASKEFQTLARLALTVDARSQTEYGVLRAFGQVNVNMDQADKKTEIDKGYIQFAGFTAGYAASFYDFLTGYSLQLKYGGIGEFDESRNLLAYTFGFGNGLSATLSVEDSISKGRAGAADAAYGGNKLPDFVAQLKLAQAWGAAQLSAAAHHQYSASGAADQEIDEYGFAVLAGIEVNLPMLGAGDKFGIQAAYADGALGYLGLGSGGVINAAGDTINVGDFNNQGETSTGWAVKGSFKHVFSPAFTFNIDAGYASIDQDDNGATGATTGFFDFTQWDVAAQIAWTPVTNLTASLGVEYRSRDVDFSGQDLDNDGWIVGARLQRNF